MIWLANRMKSAGLRNVTTVIHPGMRHETANEIGREAAIADFAQWCRRIAEQPRLATAGAAQ